MKLRKLKCTYMHMRASQIPGDALLGAAHTRDGGIHEPAKYRSLHRLVFPPQPEVSITQEEQMSLQ